MKWTPWTPGINFHPTSLEFVADDNRVYQAELPPPTSPSRDYPKMWHTSYTFVLNLATAMT